VCASAQPALPIEDRADLLISGWGLGTAGSVFEYRSVRCRSSCAPRPIALLTSISALQIWAHYNEKGHTFQQAKNEAAQHGFMAYIRRGDTV
jgi:hypothetical protein